MVKPGSTRESTREARIVAAAWKFIRTFCPEPGLSHPGRYFSELGRLCITADATPTTAALKALRDHLGTVSADYKATTSLLTREITLNEAMIEVVGIIGNMLDTRQFKTRDDAVKRIVSNLMVLVSRYAPGRGPDTAAKEQFYDELIEITG